MKNTFVKVLSLVMALMMVVGTFSTLTVFAAEHDHTKGELVGKVEPTCLKNGYSTYICGVEGCGVKWNTDVVFADAKYHNYENKAAEDATCWADAKPAAEVCSHCGLTPEGEPRPVEAGTRKLHQFVGAVTEADCLNDKKLEYTCKLCEKTAEKIYADNGFMAAQKAQYEAGEWKKVVETGTALNPGHAKLTWTVVTAPKSADGVCAAGLAEGYCDKCKTVIRTAEIPPVHTFKSLNKDNLPCIEWDESVKACSVCGILENPEAKKRDTYGHSVVKVIGTDKTTIEGLVAADYNVTVDAKNLPTKADGKQMTIAELAALGFANGAKLHKAAKCNEKGSALVQCACGLVYVKEIGTTAHNWGAGWTVNTLSAETVKCTDAVTKTRKCSACNLEETVVLKAAVATEHNYVVVEALSPVADCDSIGYTTKGCQNSTILGVTCTHKVEENFQDKLGHTWGAPVLDTGDCLNGTYKKTCSVCNATEAADKPDSVTAHNWNDKVAVDATCVDVSYKYTACAVCGFWKAADGSAVAANSDAGKTDKGTDLNGDKHVYPTVDAMKSFVNAPAGVTVTVTGIIGYAAGTTSTCTAAGKLTVKCTNNACEDKNTIITVDAPLKDHDWAENISEIEWNDNGSVKRINTALKAATCSAIGYKNNGKVCKVCKLVEKAPEVIEIDPNAHAYDPAKPIFTATATCMTPGYKQYNATCSHGVITVIQDNGALAPHNYKKDNNEDNWIDPQDAECLKDGNHKYIGCIWCKDIKPGNASMKTSIADCGCGMTGDGSAEKHADLAAAGNYIIPATGHDYAEVKEDRETCDEAGVKAHLACKNCDYKKLGDTEYDYSKDDPKKAFDLAAAIPAHYSQHTQYFDAKAPTCTSKGTSDAKKGYYCTVCQEDQWLDMDVLPHTTETFYANLAVFDGKPADFAAWVDARFAATDVIEMTLYYGEAVLVFQNQTAADAKVIVAELAEAITRVAVVDSSKSGYTPELLDCTKAGCKVERCKDCTWYKTVYVPAKNTEHKYAANWTEQKAAAGTTCYVASTKVKACTEPGCQAKLTETMTAATGHYTTKGVEGGEKIYFDYNCNKISEFAAYNCDVCGTNYMDLIRKGVIKVDGVVPNTKQAVQHDPVNLKQAATCTEDGYEISECRNCNYADQDKEFDYPAVNKKLESVGSHTLEGAVVLEKVEPTAGADGHITYICPACKQTVTETIHASMAVDSVIVPQYDAYASGNNVTATVYLTAEAFSFNKLYIDVASNLKLVDFEMLASFVDAEGNAVKASAMIDANGDVVVFVENSVTGEKKNAAFAAGSDVALLTLTFSSHKFFKGTASFSTKVVGSEIYNAETEKYDVVDLIDAVEAEIASVTFDVPGDFNGDKLFGANDLAAFLPALAEAMLSDTVENKYDLNNDGEVSLADVEGLRAYIADGQTLSSYLKMTGEDVDDALAANGTPVFVDENGVIITMDEATKKVLFAAAMDEIIAYFSVDQYIELCTRDDVNVESLTELVNFIVKLATQEAYNEADPAKRSIVFTVDKVIIRTNTDPIVIAY